LLLLAAASACKPPKLAAKANDTNSIFRLQKNNVLVVSKLAGEL
jgi:hypothetical protein